MTLRPYHDATLDEAIDRRGTPRLHRGIAFALAGGLTALLVAYGLRAWWRQQAEMPGQGRPVPPAARPASGN